MRWIKFMTRIAACFDTLISSLKMISYHICWRQAVRRPMGSFGAVVRSLQFIAVLALGILGMGPGLGAEQHNGSAALWAALKDGGHMALMRHAQAPGTGDPSGFQLDDCTTQRNLAEAGRQQAQQIGQAFRDRRIKIARVLSSRWCRCLATATLLDLGPVEPFPILDSFFQRRERGTAQTAALRRFVSKVHTGPSLILVTHQVNITALTQVFPRSGEIVVIRPRGDGEFEVLGQLSPP